MLIKLNAGASIGIGLNVLLHMFDLTCTENPTVCTHRQKARSQCHRQCQLTESADARKANLARKFAVAPRTVLGRYAASTPDRDPFLCMKPGTGKPRGNWGDEV